MRTFTALMATIVLVIGLAGCAAGPSLSSLGNALPAVTESAAGTRADAETFDPFGLREAPISRGRQVIANPTLADVLEPGPLPENSYGDPGAPVVIVKYASLTCPYCGKFHRETFPLLKREYIDTGKVRFILREFPIGLQSGTATIAWRCAPPEKRLELYSQFLNQQSRWVSQDVRRDPVYAVARQVGLTNAELDACFANEQLVTDLQAVTERGRTLGIIGTPNFFINERLEKRVLTIRDIREIVDPLLANGAAGSASAGR